MVYNHPNKGIKGGTKSPLLIFIQMISIGTIILIAKYVAYTVLLFGVIMTPAWIARQNDKKPLDMARIRVASWVFGWSVIGWLWALLIAIRK